MATPKTYKLKAVRFIIDTEKKAVCGVQCGEVISSRAIITPKETVGCELIIGDDLDSDQNESLKLLSDFIGKFIKAEGE